MNEMSWTCSTNGEGEESNAHMLLEEKPQENSPLGRPRRMWLDNIVMNLGEIDWGLYWLYLSGSG
jgi:hypothetical protein